MLKQVSEAAIILIVAISSLSFLGIDIIPIYEADAKVCNNTDSNTNDNNNNQNINSNGDDVVIDASATTCTYEQTSNDQKESDITATKDKAPFLLPIPFP